MPVNALPTALPSGGAPRASWKEGCPLPESGGCIYSLCTASCSVKFTSVYGIKTRRKHIEVFLTTLFFMVGAGWRGGSGIMSNLHFLRGLRASRMEGGVEEVDKDLKMYCPQSPFNLGMRF